MIELIQNAVPAAGLALGLALLFALILLIASIKLRVQVDPKVEAVYEVLPHIDCGACGFAGCASYAKAVAANPELIGACAPGGADCSRDVLSTAGSEKMTHFLTKPS